MRRSLNWLLHWLSSHQVQSAPSQLIALVLIAAALGISAGVGLSYVAGFAKVAVVFTQVDWPWLLAAVGAILVSLLGYYVAYRGIFHAASGAVLEPRVMRAFVMAGFSGFLSQSAALDVHAFRESGADVRETQVWVSALAGLEQGVLAIGGCAAAIALLVAGLPTPSLSVTLPWAIAPVPGFLLAFWLAAHFRGRLWKPQGLSHRIGIFLDCVDLIMALFRRPFSRDATLPGMAVFWAAEAAVLWLTLAAFGFRMAFAPLIVGYATGMLFTRRTSPLAGAGVLMVVLPVALWWSGAPLATAIVAVFAYRVLTLWLPLPLALAVIPTIREICDRHSAAIALP
jgi:uncharacterized membrane protein YbhN (UPF0104 family)